MAKTLRGLAGLVALFASASAFALGLGEIEIKSRLNQALSASIPITSSSLAELNSATVRLAGNEDFERAGIDRTDFLSSLEFEVKGDQVLVSSRQVAREPFVSFLVEVRWSGGRLLREYTVLLDPPGLPQSTPSPRGKSAEPDGTVAEPALAEPSVMRPAKNDVQTSPVEGQSYGPVQSKETLWSIASKLRPRGDISMDQMQWAIYQANRAAFDGGLTGLRSGVTLKIPGEDEIRAISAEEARAKVRGSRPQAKKSPEPVQKPAAAEPKPESAPVAAVPAAEPKVEKAPAPVQAPVSVATPAPAAVAPPAPAASPATAAPAAVPPTTPAVEAAPAQSAATAPATPVAPPVTPPAAASVKKSMVDEEPPAAVAPAPAPAAATAEVMGAAPVAPVADASPPTSTPAPPPQPSAPVQAEAPEAGGLVDQDLLPAIAGIVLLGAGVVGFLFWKRRRPTVKLEPVTPVAAAPKFDPAAVAANLTAKTAVADPPVKSAREKLEEDTRVTEPPLSNTAAMESTLANTQAREAAQARTLAQTVAQEPEIARTAGGTPRKVDFDVTAQFAAETVQINLDANDPLAEADFHLAYGLYDEAALLLKQAADKHPERVELRTKLAEVYFAAGKADEFRKTAEGLKNRLPGAQWSKVAIMGQQLCPDAALFKDAGGAAIGADIDLAFDEAPAAVAAPAAVTAEAAKAKPAETLEFNLEDFKLPTAAADAPASPSLAEAENTLQFDLGDLKLETPATAAAPAPAAASEIKLDELSLDQFDAAPDAAAQTLVAESSATVSEPALDMPTGGDEVATKLDLARAYMDMGDTDMAKSLLGEVTQQGNAQQKGEAQGLLGRLGAG